MKMSARQYLFPVGTAFGILILIGTLGAQQAHAHGVANKYAHMAPIKQYLMNRKAEIALARSAAPASISRDATVLVLGRHGYETAVKGTNGFVCMVSRGWVGTFDWPEAWNPKIRGAECLNPSAVRSILPLAEMRTKLFLAGDSMTEVAQKISYSLKHKRVPALGAGAMSYMMGKGSYLTDADGHNGPHVMFYVPNTNPNDWGANLPDSPIGGAPYWFFDKKMTRRYNLPEIYVFVDGASTWSDGTPFHSKQP